MAPRKKLEKDTPTLKTIEDRKKGQLDFFETLTADFYVEFCPATGRRTVYTKKEAKRNYARPPTGREKRNRKTTETT